MRITRWTLSRFVANTNSIWPSTFRHWKAALRACPSTAHRATKSPAPPPTSRSRWWRVWPTRSFWLNRSDGTPNRHRWTWTWTGSLHEISSVFRVSSTLELVFQSLVRHSLVDEPSTCRILVIIFYFWKFFFFLKFFLKFFFFFLKFFLKIFLEIFLEIFFLKF